MKKIFTLFAALATIGCISIGVIACNNTDDDGQKYYGDTILTLETPKLTAEVGYSSIKLEWNTIYAAKAYHLIRCETNNPTDTATVLAASTKSTSYTDSSSLERGKKYTYTLKALSTDSGNDYSSRTLYLKDSNPASITITYGDTAQTTVNPYLPTEFNNKTISALYTANLSLVDNICCAFYFFNDSTWVYTEAYSSGIKRAYKKGTYPATASPSSNGKITLSQTHSYNSTSGGWTTYKQSFSVTVYDNNKLISEEGMSTSYFTRVK